MQLVLFQQPLSKHTIIYHYMQKMGEYLPVVHKENNYPPTLRRCPVHRTKEQKINKAKHNNPVKMYPVGLVYFLWSILVSSYTHLMI